MLAGQRLRFEAELEAAKEALAREDVRDALIEIAALDEFEPVLAGRRERATTRAAAIPEELRSAVVARDHAAERLAELDRERAGRPPRAEVVALAKSELPVLVSTMQMHDLDVHEIAEVLADVEVRLAKLAVDDPDEYRTRVASALMPPEPASAPPDRPIEQLGMVDGTPIFGSRDAQPAPGGAGRNPLALSPADLRPAGW